MDNKKCVLVEFLNEEKIGTGYEAWLAERDKNEIDRIINEGIPVIISWPDCDITSSTKKMTKLLEKATIKNYAVKILKKGSKY